MSLEPRHEQLRLGLDGGRSAQLDEHIAALCARHAIDWSVGGRGRAEVVGSGKRRRYRIRTPPVRGQVSYLVALHEIGHLVGPGRSGTRLAKEAAAWHWALQTSNIEPTQATRRRIGAKLRSYVDWAERRQQRQRPPVLPPPDDRFWNLLAELEA
ncbi:MAG TPA: hypothetical protein VFJ24_13005 [Gaiellales bacterium]|nr:hypothetical protein [Gaiellales bacterium]